MKWQQPNGSTIRSGRYLIARYQLGEARHYVAQHGSTVIASYWGESAKQAMQACEEYEGRGSGEQASS